MHPFEIIATDDASVRAALFAIEKGLKGIVMAWNSGAAEILHIRNWAPFPNLLENTVNIFFVAVPVIIS